MCQILFMLQNIWKQILSYVSNNLISDIGNTR